MWTFKVHLLSYLNAMPIFYLIDEIIIDWNYLNTKDMVLTQSYLQQLIQNHLLLLSLQLMWALVGQIFLLLKIVYDPITLHHFHYMLHLVYHLNQNYHTDLIFRQDMSLLNHIILLLAMIHKINLYSRNLFHYLLNNKIN